MATLAHELRNPLSPISNAIQLWPHVASDAAEMERLRTVMSRQVQQLIRLIDDLMDMARIALGKINLRRSVVDLALPIARAVETVQPLVDASGHELIVTLPQQPVYVNGDMSRLTQVFSNILNNAAKYTPQKGVIRVLVEKQGEQVAVRIQDNGPGIPTHLLTAIFEAFRQMDRTLDCSQGGLGIGLTLAKQLVGLHGGTIEARSAGPGTGSEFVVTLPVIAECRIENDLSQPPKPRAATIRRRILVVDDLEESAETLAKVLWWMGQDATAALRRRSGD